MQSTGVLFTVAIAMARLVSAVPQPIAAETTATANPSLLPPPVLPPLPQPTNLGPVVPYDELPGGGAMTIVQDDRPILFAPADGHYTIDQSHLHDVVHSELPGTVIPVQDESGFWHITTIGPPTSTALPLPTKALTVIQTTDANGVPIIVTKTVQVQWQRPITLSTVKTVPIVEIAVTEIPAVGPPAMSIPLQTALPSSVADDSSEREQVNVGKYWWSKYVPKYLPPCAPMMECPRE
ncbi:hypothetical protein K402DRAFT_419678 [Aulographum hederae CBS 113979]|uniref:Lytic polysaccharide monooxygenase n=1 Tax=Aulographum hederae CBS 113979 TaxID=1176131 RepID=A0A6G1H545_9PEZI|nr:hypothetical protein K402DRAFT_419678 [Aulographum hederae CBS 113979]